MTRPAVTVVKQISRDGRRAARAPSLTAGSRTALLLVALSILCVRNMWPVVQPASPPPATTTGNPVAAHAGLNTPPTPSPTRRVCVPYDSGGGCDFTYNGTLGDWSYVNQTVLFALRRGNGWASKAEAGRDGSEATRELGVLLSQDTALRRRAYFEGIYTGSVWQHGGGAVGSGTGSTLLATVHARKAILDVVDKYNVSSILDASCGDLTWMRELFPELDRRGVRYVGVDTVRPVIERLNKEFEADENKTFMVRDLVADPMPKGADLIISRQVSVPRCAGRGRRPCRAVVPPACARNLPPPARPPPSGRCSST